MLGTLVRLRPSSRKTHPSDRQLHCRRIENSARACRTVAPAELPHNPVLTLNFVAENSSRPMRSLLVVFCSRLLAEEVRV